MGDADAFERLSSQINPAGSAFTERLAQAAKEFSALQAVERELRQDEQKFTAHMAGLRQGLEATSKTLSAAHAKRARLAKELAACDEEIAVLEKNKAETTAQIHMATTSATSEREEKLRKLDRKAASSRPPQMPAAPSAGSPPPDLLGDGPLMSSAPPVDLLGGAEELGPLDLLTAGLSAATPTSRPPAAMPAAMPAVMPTLAAPPPPASAGGDFFEGFDDISSAIPAPTLCNGSMSSCGLGGSSAANPFDMPPAGMSAGLATPAHPFGGAMAPPAMAVGGMPSRPPMPAALGPPPSSSKASTATDPFAGLMGLGKP